MVSLVSQQKRTGSQPGDFNPVQMCSLGIILPVPEFLPSPNYLALAVSL